MILLAAMLVAATPAKLVVLWANAPAITDYPSMERCEAARRALHAKISLQGQMARDMAKQSNEPVMVPAVTTYCIPG